MNYIVLDLEATCWESRDKQPNEIIEIGAVCIGPEKTILGEFSQFVKPTVYPELSDFCKELTTITQRQVDKAELFPAVVAAFQDWMALFGTEYVLCSWGNYDRMQLQYDCEMHHLETDWLKNHISLKHQYGTIKKLKRPIGMAGALKMEQLTMEGTHHRGIDDARNIAKIFVQIFEQWEFPKA